ncbi:N-acetylglucosamine kinase [Microbacterium sp. CJ88]|uniref:N-acetylglucosamine kinase n=1 Tax=Microbacterium sp. CJ88 TaxID=3445672 RepID=UPI003F65843D
MHHDSVLAIDAGQTGIKVRVSGATEDRTFPGIRTDTPLLPQLAAVARAVLADAPGAADVVAAGVSGLTAAEADPAALAGLLEGTGVRTAVLAHDSTTSFLGALGDERGTVVAAGTGVVTLAVGEASVARVDGWGYLMGDAGSGFWIGREALDAVMRAYDGRGPATELTDVVTGRWPELPDAYLDLQADAHKVGVIASFAEPVARLADAGDAVALAISRRAARELATSAVASLARVGLTDSPAVCAIGGVFRSSALRAAFDAFVAADLPGARLVEPRGVGIDGVALLPGVRPGHPLSTAVWRFPAL